MNNYPGGYQIVDFGGLELGDATTTIVNRNVANILRECSKPVIFTGIKQSGGSLKSVSVMVADSGVKDGKVYYFIGINGTFTVTTNGGKITFTAN